MGKRSIRLIALALAGAVLLAGCVVSVKDSESADTQASALGTIMVNASETIDLTPDMAELSFSVETEGTTVDEATEANTAIVDAIVAYLREAGYAESSISTSNMSLYPYYDYSSMERQLTGYHMSTTIRVTDIEKDDVDAVLTDVLALGVNSLGSISYYSSRYDEAYEEALNAAIARAQAKAESIAESLGCEVGSVVSLSEGYDSGYARYSTTNSHVEYDRAVEETETASGSASLGVNVLPADIEVTAYVTVEYGLK